MSDLDRRVRTLEETTQVLAGQGRGDPLQAALRRADLVLGALQSAQVSGSVTVADFNALQTDVSRLHALLADLAAGK